MLLARTILPVGLIAVLACSRPPAAPPVTASTTTSVPDRKERIAATTMPAFEKPVPFDTPEADAILAALEVLPPDNPWNLVVEDWPRGFLLVQLTRDRAAARVGLDHQLLVLDLARLNRHRRLPDQVAIG